MREFEMSLNTPPIKPKSPDSTPPEVQLEKQESKLEECNRYIKELETEAIEIRRQLESLSKRDPIGDLDINHNILQYEYEKGAGFNTKRPASPDTIKRSLEREYSDHKRRTSDLELTDERIEEMSRRGAAYTELLEIFTDPDKIAEQKQILSNHETKNDLESELSYIEDDLSKLKTIRTQLEMTETAQRRDEQSRQISDGYMKFQQREEKNRRRLADPRHQKMMSLLEEFLKKREGEKKTSNF